MYSEEVKIEVIELLDNYSIKEVAELKQISVSTLYRWLKEYRTLILKEQSKIIKKYIKQNRLDEAEDIANKFPDNEIIQSQLMTIYTKQNRLVDAKSLASKFPNYEPIQSQLMTVYIKQNRFADAEDIAVKYPGNEIIRNKLITIYNYEYGLEAETSSYVDIKESFLQPTFELAKDNSSEISEEVAQYLYYLREKIYLNTISIQDVRELSNISDKVSNSCYKFILAAICEKLGMKKDAINALKSIEDERYLKKRNVLIEDLKSKKKKFFDLGKWDELIPWLNVEAEEQFIPKTKRKKLQEN